MFEGITSFFKKFMKNNSDIDETSKDTAKERLHLVLMQDRANVSADFLDLMKQEIIEVIKKYVEVDEKDIDVRLTNQANDDGTNGAPALYANIPIVNIKNDVKGEKMRKKAEEEKDEKEESNDEKMPKKTRKRTRRKSSKKNETAESVEKEINDEVEDSIDVIKKMPELDEDEIEVEEVETEEK